MIYHSFHNQYEIIVRKSAQGSYLVVYLPYAPDGQETVLHAYPREEEAIRGAKLFPERYQHALLRGYVLENQSLLHSSGKSIHLSFAMDLSISSERFRVILDSAS